MNEIPPPPHEVPVRRRRYRMGCVVAVVLGIGLAGSAVNAILKAREAARQSNCRGRMSQLAMALQNYHDFYGSFPPAFVPDTDGTPMHSWRVLLLPFIDGGGIYKQYRFDEPWNSPHNLALGQRTSNAWFQCPSGPRSDMTDYVVVVGPGTAFPGSASTKLADFHDGSDNSILLVEIHNSNIPWMEPRDLSADQMSYLVNDPTRPSISGPHSRGPGVVFANGINAYRLQNSLRAETVKSLTTISGGEPVFRDKLILKDSHHFLGE